MFVVYCAQYGFNAAAVGNRAATIRGKLSAVQWFHRVYLGSSFPIPNAVLGTLRGIQRNNLPLPRTQPVTIPILLQLQSVLLHRGQSHFLLLTWGLVVLAVFFLLRRSEYLLSDGKFHHFVARLQNLKLCDAEGRPTRPATATSVSLELVGAKNDQFGRGSTRFLHASGHETICPVVAAKLIHQIHIRSPPSTPLAFLTPREVVSSQMVASLIKTAATLSGNGAATYSTHSLRIGGATALLDAGAGDLLIKFLGRWSSDAFQRYPAHRPQQTSGLARLMVGGTPTRS